MTDGTFEVLTLHSRDTAFFRCVTADTRTPVRDAHWRRHDNITGKIKTDDRHTIVAETGLLQVSFLTECLVTKESAT